LQPKNPTAFYECCFTEELCSDLSFRNLREKELFDWFVAEYPKHTKRKLDMGKSCVRFKKMDDIPFELIGELCQKMTVKEWVNTYESAIKKK